MRKLSYEIVGLQPIEFKSILLITEFQLYFREKNKQIKLTNGSISTNNLNKCKKK